MPPLQLFSKPVQAQNKQGSNSLQPHQDEYVKQALRDDFGAGDDAERERSDSAGERGAEQGDEYG